MFPNHNVWNPSRNPTFFIKFSTGIFHIPGAKHPRKREIQRRTTPAASVCENQRFTPIEIAVPV